MTMETSAMSYDEKIRLAEIIGDARKLLAEADSEVGLPRYCGRLEAMLKMLADSAEIAADVKPDPGSGLESDCPRIHPRILKGRIVQWPGDELVRP